MFEVRAAAGERLVVENERVETRPFEPCRQQPRPAATGRGTVCVCRLQVETFCIVQSGRYDGWVASLGHATAVKSYACGDRTRALAPLTEHLHY